jgi:uncharacterized membrane protein YhaH (DUF805 family)
LTPGSAVGTIDQPRPAGRGLRLGSLLSFDGRIGRRDYWLTMLIGIGSVAGCAVLLDSSRSPLAVGIGALVGIVAWWICLAASVKRWHDRNKAGTWVLIVLIPLVGAIWALIETGFVEGTTGPNDYGQPSGGSPFPRH